jgi:hypothetical protein
MSLNRALGVSTPIRLCSHVAGVRVRELLFLSGHGPLRKNGVPAFKGTLGIEISPDAGAWIILGATLNAISSANRLLGGLEEIEAVVPGPLTFREHSISPGSDPPISCTIAFILTASCIWQNEPKLFDSDQTFQAPRALWFRAVVTIGGYKATCATTDVLARRLPRFHERHFENG